MFEKQKVKVGKQTAEIVEEDPYAIQMISWCPESRMFCVAGISAHVIVYRFSKHEVTSEILVSSYFFLCYSQITKYLFPRGKKIDISD